MHYPVGMDRILMWVEGNTPDDITWEYKFQYMWAHDFA